VARLSEPARRAGQTHGPQHDAKDAASGKTLAGDCWQRRGLWGATRGHRGGAWERRLTTTGGGGVPTGVWSVARAGRPAAKVGKVSWKGTGLLLARNLLIRRGAISGEWGKGQGGTGADKPYAQEGGRRAPGRRVAMPRAPRPCAPEATVHVGARCNNREVSFTAPEDFEAKRCPVPLVSHT
jgi:hypothetical protein